MKFNIKTFSRLSTKELYEILQLRQQIFSVEQNCAYLDADGYDQQAVHVMGYDKTTLIAYARLIKPGIVYETASVGRVIVHHKYRRFGYGYKLMEKALLLAANEYGYKTITISAQLYLEKFYQNLGFKTSGKAYLEDGLPHIKMINRHV